MNVYLLVHRQPDDYVATPGTNAKWIAWFKEFGDALVDLGYPVLDDRGCIGETGSAPPLGGYIIIRATSRDESPHLHHRKRPIP